jgi:hypothetical protein
MKKHQSAVEWLVEKLMKGEFINTPTELIEQAKEMEKQQMFGFTNHHHVIGEGTERFFKEEFELWYNETYGSKGSDDSPKVENKDSFGEISDEEIRKAAIEYANNVYDKNDFKDEWRGVLNDFIAATKWYREQLKTKQ